MAMLWMAPSTVRVSVFIHLSPHVVHPFHIQPCFKTAWAEHRKLHKTGGGAGAGAGAGVDPHARTPTDGCVWKGLDRCGLYGDGCEWRVPTR